MPKEVDKDFFKKLLVFYDEDVIEGAGMRIRRMAKAADELMPTQRIIRIAEIFSCFRNPAKETVLTPWRVVNMHMGDMIGGYNFYAEGYPDKEGVLENPRLLEQGEVTSDIFLDENVRVLEMNSKSGLYPLYIAYSIYRMMLPREEKEMALEEAQEYWRRALNDHLFVLCQTTMAVAITKRTLAGYTGDLVNAIYLTKLLDRMENQKRLSNKLRNPATWGKEGDDKMKFNAVVGNPPYQSETGGGSDRTAATQAKPIFQLFVEQAKSTEPDYISMIIPARWYNGGIGLSDFRKEMLNDKRIMKLMDFSNSKELFPTVDIAGGICYFLWHAIHDDDCVVVNSLSGRTVELKRSLSEFGEFFIRSNSAIPIIEKVLAKTNRFVSDMASAIDTFGIPSKEKGHEEYSNGDILLLHSVGANGQGTDFISRDKVSKNTDLIDKFKIKISILVPQNGEVGVDPAKGYRSISSPQILYPGTVDTFSYLNIGFFDTETEAINFRNYMTCKLPRFMMRTTYSSVHISKANFIFVPMLDFTQEWTDQKLYEFYGFTEEEVEIIEKTMRPLVLEKDDIGKDFYNLYTSQRR